MIVSDHLYGFDFLTTRRPRPTPSVHHGYRYFPWKPIIESHQLYGKDIHAAKARQRPRCGARLRGERAGLFCQRRVVQHPTTCPNHLGCCRQGMSKGATTVEGRARWGAARLFLFAPARVSWTLKAIYYGWTSQLSRLADLQRICSIHRQTMPAQGRGR